MRRRRRVARSTPTIVVSPTTRSSCMPRTSTIPTVSPATAAARPPSAPGAQAVRARPVAGATDRGAAGTVRSAAPAGESVVVFMCRVCRRHSVRTSAGWRVLATAAAVDRRVPGTWMPSTAATISEQACARTSRQAGGHAHGHADGAGARRLALVTSRRRPCPPDRRTPIGPPSSDLRGLGRPGALGSGDGRHTSSGDGPSTGPTKVSMMPRNRSTSARSSMKSRNPSRSVL